MSPLKTNVFRIEVCLLLLLHNISDYIPKYCVSVYPLQSQIIRQKTSNYGIYFHKYYFCLDTKESPLLLGYLTIGRGHCTKYQQFVKTTDLRYDIFSLCPF